MKLLIQEKASFFSLSFFLKNLVFSVVYSGFSVIWW
jgi:hypothetical protein